MKKGGGMGVRNFRMHNKSLLYKWLWRYNDGKESTWKKLIDVKYVKKDTWRPAIVHNSTKGSIWSNISKLWNEFHQYTKLKLGNEKKN